MITSAERRPRPYLEIALILSVLLHLFGAGIFEQVRHLAARVHQQNERSKPQEEFSAVSDEIHLEKRTVPREAHHQSVPKPQRPTPPHPRSRAMRPRVAQLPVPPALTTPTRNVQPARPKVEHEEAHIVKRAAPEPQTAKANAEGKAERSAGIPQPKLPPHAYSPEQIAAIQSQFSRTIAQARTDLTTLPKPKQSASTRKHYNAVLAGSLRELLHYEGEYRPTQVRGNGKYNVYYLHLSIVFSDGTSEDVDLPWPVTYPVSNDPVARHAGLPAVPAPPPGYLLPHPFALSRTVCDFYRADCIAVLKAEGANAGNAPPVLAP